MNDKINEIVVIGGNEFNLGFQLAGIRNIIDAEENAEQKFKEIFEAPSTGIIITDDKTIEQLSARFREIVELSVKPGVVVLSIQSREESLRQMIIKSIGVDLWEK